MSSASFPLAHPLLLLGLLSLVACASEDGSDAASDSDAQVDAGSNPGPDAGSADAGSADTGVADTGLADTGLSDSGLDAGMDAGVVLTSTITFHDYFLAVDVTPDGRTAVFEGFEGLDAKLIFVDTITGVATDKGVLGDPGRNLATGVANDRRVSALHNDPVQAGIFNDDGTGWRDLGSPFTTPCSMDVSGAFDLSANGRRVVGLAWNDCVPRAFVWTETGTGAFRLLEQLGSSLTGSPANRATVISDNGQVIGGFAQLDNIDRSPALWRANGNGNLIWPSTDTPGEVVALNTDGSAAGVIYGLDAYLWTAGTGTTAIVRFNQALPSDPVFPNVISGDGSTVFGGVGDAFSGVPIAFAWTATGGMVPLIDLATAAGLTLPNGMILNSVLGASIDGKLLIGTATDNAFAPKTFILRLP